MRVLRSVSGQRDDVPVGRDGADVMAEIDPFLKSHYGCVPVPRPMRFDVVGREPKLRRLVAHALALHVIEAAFVRRAGQSRAPAIHEQRAEIPVGNARLPKLSGHLPPHDAPPATQDRLLAFIRRDGNSRILRREHNRFSKFVCAATQPDGARFTRSPVPRRANRSGKRSERGVSFA